nr:suppressor of fused domain protein [Deinococcus humi]
MKDTHVLTSLGLTHFQAVLGEAVEIVVPVSELDDVVADTVMASLTFLLYLRVTVPEVSFLHNVQRSVPVFAERYGKVAFAFAEPYLFPDAFAHLALPKSESIGKVRMGFFLSEGEVNMMEREGLDALYALFEEQQVDVIDLRRPSVV